MKLSEKEINAVIAKGIGIPPSDGECGCPDGAFAEQCELHEVGGFMGVACCPPDCRHLTPVYRDFFSWEGFGVMMQWWDRPDNPAFPELWPIMKESSCEDWLVIVPLAFASHFTRSEVELKEDE